MRLIAALWMRLLALVSVARAGRQAADWFSTIRALPIVDPRAADVAALAELSFCESPHGEIALHRWPQPSKPKLLVAHGWSDGYANLASLVIALSQAGFDVYAADMPGHGRSPGTMSNMGEFICTIRHVDRFVGGFHAVVAHSLGACCAALATSPSIVAGGAPLRAKRLALLAPPDCVHDFVEQFQDALWLPHPVRDAMEREFCRRVGGDYRLMSAAAALAAYEGKALVIHDRDDRRVPVSDFTAIKAAAGFHRFHETSGLGHRRILLDEDVMTHIVEFLTE